MEEDDVTASARLFVSTPQPWRGCALHPPRASSSSSSSLTKRFFVHPLFAFGRWELSADTFARHKSEGLSDRPHKRHILPLGDGQTTQTHTDTHLSPPANPPLPPPRPHVTTTCCLSTHEAFSPHDWLCDTHGSVKRHGRVHTHTHADGEKRLFSCVKPCVPLSVVALRHLYNPSLLHVGALALTKDILLSEEFFFFPKTRLASRDVFCSARFKNDVIIERSKNVVNVGFLFLDFKK